VNAPGDGGGENGFGHASILFLVWFPAALISQERASGKR